MLNNYFLVSELFIYVKFRYPFTWNVFTDGNVLSGQLTPSKGHKCILKIVTGFQYGQAPRCATNHAFLLYSFSISFQDPVQKTLKCRSLNCMGFIIMRIANLFEQFWPFLQRRECEKWSDYRVGQISCHIGWRWVKIWWPKENRWTPR